MPKHKSVSGRKSVKVKKVIAKKAKPIYDSDVPDEGADSYHKDDIDLYNEQLGKDSDSEYSTEGIPVAKAPRKEAVYDFSDSEDEEEMEKRLRKIEASVRRRQQSESSEDAEEAEEDESEGRARAWGKKRDDFYGADVSSKVDVGVSSDEEETEAMMEEKEAIRMQKKMASRIDESDYGLDWFMDTSAPSAGSTAAVSQEAKEPTEQTVIQTDYSNMSVDEKNALVKKMWPEFIPIVTDYRDKLNEYRFKIRPILDLHKRKLLPDSDGIKLLKYKAQMVLAYCQICQFYLVLRAEKSPVEGHPVIKRMVQFKEYINQIENAEQRIKGQIDYALRMIKEGKEDQIKLKTKPAQTTSSKTPAKVKKSTKTKKDAASKKDKTVTKAKKAARTGDEPKKSMQSLLDDEDETVEDMTAGEKEALEFYEVMRARRRAGADDTGIEDEEEGDVDVAAAGDAEPEEGDEKRAITEEMQKNRGLTAKRPKALKNPRIKNKLKYQKKKKIHKSIVPTVLTEMSRYSGEVSGIRAGRIRSVKLS